MKRKIILIVSLIVPAFFLINSGNHSISLLKSAQDACPGIDVYPSAGGGPEYWVQVEGNGYDLTKETEGGHACFNLSGSPAGYYKVTAWKYETGCRSRTLNVYWSSGAVYCYPAVNICEGHNN